MKVDDLIRICLPTLKGSLQVPDEEVRPPLRQAVHRQHAVHLRRGEKLRRQVLRPGAQQAAVEEQLLKHGRCTTG